MKGLMRRINKSKLFALKEKGAAFKNSSGMQCPHQTISAALLADRLDLLIKDYESVAIIGECPESFLVNLKKGRSVDNQT